MLGLWLNSHFLSFSKSASSHSHDAGFTCPEISMILCLGPLFLCFSMARLTVAAFMNWGLAPTIVTNFIFGHLPLLPRLAHPITEFLVFEAAGFAGGLVLIEVELDAALAHPALDLCRITHHEGIIRHVINDHGSCAYKGESPHRVPVSSGCLVSLVTLPRSIVLQDTGSVRQLWQRPGYSVHSQGPECLAEIY